MLFAISAIGGLWLALPVWVIVNYCLEFNWIAGVCIAWLVVFPIFLVSAFDDGKPISLIPPAPPPAPPKPKPPKHVGRMGGE